MRVLEFEQVVPASIDKVFEFFSEAKNLETITPSFLGFRILKLSTPAIERGTLIWYRLRLHGVPLRWKTLISIWRPPYEFVDEQLSGPYKKWHHTHIFESVEGGTCIRDRVVFELPFGRLGEWIAGRWVQRDVEKIFAYRRTVIEQIFGSSNP